MKLHSIKEKVSKIDISNKYIIKWEKDVIYVNEHKLTSDKIFHFERYKNCLLVQYNDERITDIFNLKSMQSKRINKSGSFLSQDIILTGQWNDTYTERLVTAMHIVTENILWESNDDFSFIFENNDFFFSLNNKKFSYRKTNSCELIWQIPSNDLLKISEKEYELKKIVGLYLKQLFIALKPNSIITLDIASGKLINTFNIQDSFPTLIDFQKDTFSTSYHLDEINNRLIILSYTTLFHINLITKEVKLIKDYHNLPQQEQWRFMSATLFKDKIYFTGDLGLEYVVATRVGVMNVETGEILWQQQLQKTGGLPNAPQVTEDKLYVHTVNGQLYIYDSEENIS